MFCSFVQRRRSCLTNIESRSVRMLVAGAVLVSCTGCDDRQLRSLTAGPPETDDGWQVAAPARLGVAVEPLEELVRQIEEGSYSGIDSVLVVKDGRLVLERYFNGYGRMTHHEIRSATKSIGSMLVGMAIDRGLIASEDALIWELLPADQRPEHGWTERARLVRIRHLLSMTSGYECDDLATSFACEHAMHRSEDWLRFALDLPLARAPGEHWAYNSASLTILGEVVETAAGEDLDDFARRHLFEPLGIERFEWQRSPRGKAWMGGGARMVPREMARIGQLMLERGRWNGRQLLSEAWVEKSTRKQADAQTGVDYGYLWQSGRAFVAGRLLTAFWASGNGGQHIIVVPEADVVVTFTGSNYDSPLASQPFRMLVEYVLPAVLKAPTPPKTVPSLDELKMLAGTYRLTLEPSVHSSIELLEDSLVLVSPDGEAIDLSLHAPPFFTGRSPRYGPLAVEFDLRDGTALGYTVYGSFQEFTFEREPS